MRLKTGSRYAMYLRKSRADLELEALGNGETLARHRTMLLDLAARMEILTDQITEYREVVSGESIAARPEMQRLLNDVYLKKYAGVLVVEVERLARGNTKDQGEVADAFQYSNTMIITPSKVYNPSNEFDQEYFEFGLFMSRREYKTIKRRMEAGRIQSVHEGNYVGSSRPYGYNIKRINKKERILVVNEAEAPVVKQIFNWFTEDRKTCGQIAKDLTKAGILTLTGNTEWNRGTVKDILNNIHYTGYVRWNRRRSTKEYDAETGSLNQHKRRLTPEDYQVFKGKHEALISKEQFDFAQTLFTGQVPVHVNDLVANPFAGILVCAGCGKAMRYQHYKKALPRYAHIDSVNCTKKSVSAQAMNAAIVEALQTFIDDFTVEIKNASQAEKTGNYEALIEQSKKELKKQEATKEKLFDLLEDGTYTKEEFIERKQICLDRIEIIKNQIKNLQDHQPKIIDYKEKTVTIQHCIEMLNNDSVSPKSKNDFMKTFIDRIEYDVVDLGRNKGGKPVLDVFLK